MQTTASLIRSFCFCASLLCVTGIRAQQTAPPGPAQVPPLQQRIAGVVTLRANARAVLLDVVVTDSKGHPVHGLTTLNFRLFEDGKPQTITSLEEHQPFTAAELASRPTPLPLAPNTFTNARSVSSARSSQVPGATTVFLLDALDTPLAAQSYVRDQLLAYFNTMQPGTEVAIFQLDTQLRQIQGFTSDPAVLRTAIKERDKPLQTAIPAGPGYVTQALRMDVLNDAMQSLGSYLRSRPGRKNLIWFTAHIPRSAYDDGTAMGGALRDSEAFLFDYTRATDALVLGQVSVYPVDSRGLQTDPAFNASQRRGPSVASTREFSTRQFFEHSDLDQVAEATGGKAFYNTNGIRQIVSEVVDTGSNFYTLSFSPGNKKWDGRYRTLKVQVEGNPVPQSVQLAYRRGYFAVADAPSLAQQGQAPSRPQPGPTGRIQLTHSSRPDEEAFAKVMQLGAVDPAQILFEAHVDESATINKLSKNQPQPQGVFLAPKYRERPFRLLDVTFHLPGDQMQLTGMPNGLHQGHLEFVALILDEKGDLVASGTSTVDMNLKPATYSQVQASGVLLGVKVALPEKGSYFLRAGVHDRSNGRSGAIETSTGNIKLLPITP